MTTTFITFLLLICWADCGWKAHDDIRTGKTVMVSSLFSNSSIPISQNISYSSALSGTTSAGIGIIGYKTYITNDFSLNTTIENFTTSWMQLTVHIYGDTTITYFAVNWIATGPDAVDFLDLNYDCFLCSTISEGNGTREETRTGTTFFSGESLTTNVFFSGFKMHNSEGITNYLNVIGSVASGESTIEYTFTTNQNNTVEYICYTTILFCEACTYDYYYFWGVSGQKELSNNTDPIIFNPDNRYQDQDRMFFGISSLNISRAQDRYFDIDTTDYTNLETNYISNFGTYNVAVDYFWIVERTCNTSVPEYFNVQTEACEDYNCSGGLYQTTPGYFCTGCYYWCLTCDGSHPENCTSCDSTKFRYHDNAVGCLCQSGYVDTDQKDQQCYPCDTYIAGCDTCTSTTVCDTCQSGFVSLPDGTCGCTAGYLVTGVCTNVTGCTSAIQYSGDVYCVACNSTLNFQRTSDYQCQCTTGYLFDDVQNCDPICGDGIKLSVEQCDDNNTKDNDGCSSTCTVQDKWACFNGSTTSASVCLIDDTFTISINYVKRILNANTMQVSLSITPEYSQLTQINFKQNFSHNIPTSNYNTTYTDNQLILVFQYSQTIQDGTYTLQFVLDPDIFYNATLSHSLLASGMNSKLTYDTYYANNQGFSTVIIVVDVLVILVLLVSILTQKMIGIQMIQAYQSVLFSMAILKTVPAPLSPLTQLQYLSGYNSIQGSDDTRTYPLSFSLSSIGLQKQFLLSFNLMYAILLLIIIITIITKFIQRYQQAKLNKEEDSYLQIQKSQSKAHKATMVFNFLFERLLILIGFMLFFLVVMALMVQLTDMEASYTLISKELNLLGGGVAMAVMMGLVVLVVVNGVYPSTRLFPHTMKRGYLPFYVLYQTTFIFLLAFNYTQTYTLYILLGMSLCFMVFVILYQPYPQCFHSFVLVYHQLIIMLALGIFVYQSLTTDESQLLYTIVMYVLVGLLFVGVFLNIYRIYRHFKYCDENDIDLWNYQYVPMEESLENRKLLSKPMMKDTKEMELKELSKYRPRGQDIQKKTGRGLDQGNNELTDQERVQATGRKPEPESSREAKTNLKNVYVDDEPPHDSYMETRNKGKYLAPNSPLQEDFEQDMKKESKMGMDEDDKLKLIKMSLRQDLNKKKASRKNSEESF